MPVNTQHAKYKEFLEKWTRCRDVSAGQSAVHAAGEKYLPKLKDQPADDYKNYVRRATFYNATWRTIIGLLGMMFRKPAKVEVPSSVEPLLEDIDAAGTPLQVFIQDVSENAMTVGRVGVLVDYPRADPNVTQADAQALNLRPMMQLYRAESIINWRVDRVENQMIPTQVVLKESETVSGEDEFTSKEEERWRVLDLEGPGRTYRQRVFKAKVLSGSTVVQGFDQVGADIFPMMNGKAMEFIPFVVMGTDDVGFEVDEPPLIDLVDMNLSHYRTTADYEHGCHFTGLPTLFLAGFTKENPNDKVYIGSESAITTSNPNAKASYVEFSGQGLSALEKNLDRKEKQMAILGARMLEPQIRQVESAEAAGIHRKGEESALASMAVALSLGMTEALKWFTQWAGAPSENVSVEVNRNFLATPMSPAMLNALLMGWQSGAPGLSDQGLFDQLKAGEIVRDDVTLEDEQARIQDKQVTIAEQNAVLQGMFTPEDETQTEDPKKKKKKPEEEE